MMDDDWNTSPSPPQFIIAVLVVYPSKQLRSKLEYVYKIYLDYVNVLEIENTNLCVITSIFDTLEKNRTNWKA